MVIRIACISCLALPLLAGCAKPEQTEEQLFRERFQHSFVASCRESSSRGPNALPPAVAEEKCRCMARYLLATYSVDELTALSSGDGPGTHRVMQAAINACR